MIRRVLLFTMVVAITTAASGGVATAADSRTTAGLPAEPGAATAPAVVHNESVTFADSRVTEQRGDVIEFELRLAHTGTASFTIGSETADFEVSGTVTDENGDSRVTVVFNTATNELTAAGGDSFQQAARTEPNGTLAAGSYQVNAVPGTTLPADNDNDPTTGTIELTQRATTAFETFTAPASFTPQNASAIQRAQSSGPVVSADTVAAGDVVVSRLAASGLEGTVAAANGTTLTERFFNAVNVSLQEDGATTTDDPKQVVIGPDSTTVYTTGDQYYLVTDTSALPSDADFTARLAVASTPAPDLFGAPATTPLAVEPPSVSFTKTDTTLDTARVRGETNLAPGTELRITIRADTAGDFLRAARVTVRANNTFVATFTRLPGGEVGDAYTLRAFPVQTGPSASSPDPIGEADGELIAPDTPTATATPAATATPTATATPAATVTPAATATPTPATTVTPADTDASAPGFTPLLVVLALVLTAGLLARRR